MIARVFFMSTKAIPLAYLHIRNYLFPGSNELFFQSDYGLVLAESEHSRQASPTPVN